MSEMNLNLIPSKAKFQAARINLQKKARLVITLLLSLWLASGAIMMSVIGVVQLRLNSAIAAQKSSQQNYLAMQEDIVVNQKLKYRAKMVGEVIDTRFEYGKSFEIINELFPSSINIKNFDLKDEGLFEVKGTTSGKDNVDLLERTLEIVNRGENDKLAKVKITSLAMKAGVWDFTMEVRLK